MKIYTFPFAITIESSLSIEDIKLLQKYDPRALALHDIAPNGTEYETFRIEYSKGEFGCIDTCRIIFVGETNDKKAGLSILLPAKLSGDAKAEYINDKLAAISNSISIIENNATKAIEAVKATQKCFKESIIELQAAAIKGDK